MQVEALALVCAVMKQFSSHPDSAGITSGDHSQLLGGDKAATPGQRNWPQQCLTEPISLGGPNELNMLLLIPSATCWTVQTKQV